MSLCITNPGGGISFNEISLSKIPPPGRSRSSGKRQCFTIRSSSSPPPDPQPEIHEHSRRDFFLASTASAIGLSALGSMNHEATAAPIELNNFLSCRRATIPQGTRINCCPPNPQGLAPIDFVYNNSLPPRQRQAAHLVNQDYISKYSRAYQLMRSLPDSDPRSFRNQANAHCAYCNDAFSQSGSSSLLQIHNNWLFLPWHRWYLYFHERILGSLIGDNSFAIPFWNWDDNPSGGAPNSTGNTMPSIYLNNQPLGDSLRDSLHFPPRLVDLNFSGRDDSIPGDAQSAENNALMYQQIVSGARTASLFHGGVYRAGDPDTPGAGTLENAPHGPVHVWTGSGNQPNREDMGTLYSAARDPIFFAHHANIDRLWAVWKTIPGGRRRDFTDPDWLDAKFLFYDENSRLVRVTVRDALDPEQLGFSYSPRPDAWINARPTALGRLSSGSASAPSVSGWMDSPKAAIGAESSSSSTKNIERIEEKIRRLEGNFSARVKRDPGRRSGDELEEILVVEGVEIDCNKASKFDVYINLPEAGERSSCNVVEYVGTFVNVPHSHEGMTPEKMVRRARLRLGIGETIEQLGLSDAEEIVVTLVPRGLGKKFAPVVFKNITIEYE